MYTFDQYDLEHLTLMNILTAKASDADKVSAFIMTANAFDKLAIEAEQERQAQEIARDSAWLGVTHIVNNQTNGTIRFGSESPIFGSAEWFDGIKEIPL